MEEYHVPDEVSKCPRLPVPPEDMALRVREFSVVAEMLLFSGQYLDIVPGTQTGLKEALEISGRHGELVGFGLAVSVFHQS